MEVRWGGLERGPPPGELSKSLTASACCLRAFPSFDGYSRGYRGIRTAPHEPTVQRPRARPRSGHEGSDQWSTLTEAMMTQRAPHRSAQSYRHEAFLWRGPADFTAAMVQFIEEGL